MKRFCRFVLFALVMQCLSHCGEIQENDQVLELAAMQVTDNPTCSELHEGKLIYNSTQSKFYYCNDTGNKTYAWVESTLVMALANSSCTQGQVAKKNAEGKWECADDIDTDTDTLAAINSCTTGQVAKRTANGWECVNFMEPIFKDTYPDESLSKIFFQEDRVAGCSDIGTGLPLCLKYNMVTSAWSIYCGQNDLGGNMACL